MWVYGREGNGCCSYVLNPGAALTSRMPLRLLKLLSGLITLPVTLAAKTVYRMPGMGARLPYGQLHAVVVHRSFQDAMRLCSTNCSLRSHTTCATTRCWRWRRSKAGKSRELSTTAA